MIYGLITFGGILFWILVAGFVLGISSLINDEKPGRASVVLLIAVALAVAFTNIPIIELVKTHPEYIGYGVGAYILGAGTWALIKWRVFYLPKVFEKYETLRNSYMEAKGLKEIPANPAVRAELKSFMEGKYFYIDSVRSVSKNKARITTWMFYWPFSLISTFFGDFLNRVFATIYKTIYGLLQSMSDRMAGRYSELS